MKCKYFSWHIILIIELKNVGKDGGSVINGCEFEFLWHIFIRYVHLLCPLRTKELNFSF